MSEYNFRAIEKKWQKTWEEQQVYKAEVDPSKPKYYALDMFPYPSGAGLHVGHPLGYIASDIVSRFKRLHGYNVLHPMGFDAFGLPAEQYAIQTGQHPAVTTEQNIARYKEQLKNIGFSFDWSKEVITCAPDYYRWTQWIFMQLFNAWYDKSANKARHITDLIRLFEQEGNRQVQAECDEDTPSFDAAQWKAFSEKEHADILLKYRLTYLSEAVVNWCPALGTVLSNDEVKDGYSERGGHPVERKKMQQWSMRITAYADHLLQGLDSIDWPEPIKEMQRNWIGKSLGAELDFKVADKDLKIRVFTTRIDTIYGVTFMAIAPESELVDVLTTPEQKEIVDAYVNVAKNRSERERMSEVKRVSGEFTGSFAINPYTHEQIPIYIADYVLAGYGTGAVMAVPGHDERDHRFAQFIAEKEGKDRYHYIRQVIEGPDVKEEAFPGKGGTIINSGMLNGLEMKAAMQKAIEYAEAQGIGQAKVNFRMRDAIFSRQRYWGEPVPVYYKNDIPYLIDKQELPLILPEIDKYLPTETGEPPLGRAADWKYQGQYEYEKSTMPGWAGSSWYFFRYMDPQNSKDFCSKEAQAYWENVDLYIGGSEHATGHLLYARFWCKFLFDMGLVTVEEPFKKLINQGMIQGRSNFVYRLNTLVGHIGNEGIDKNDLITTEDVGKIFISHELYKDIENPETQRFILSELNKLTKDVKIESKKSLGDIKPSLFTASRIHVDVNIVHNDILKIEEFIKWRPEFKNAKFICKTDGKYHCGAEVEKMSKSKYNVVNPDDIIERYGADTLRLYEMFLGPLEQFKPWNTNGIDGVFKFLRKYWRLFHNEAGELALSDAEASKEELKALHAAIGKAQDDIERFSFNTSVSTFMICVNTLTDLQCNKRAILEPLTIIMSPYAPHITEELWEKLGHKESINKAKWPEFKPEYLKENDFTYPISVNGKHRDNMTFAVDMPKEEIEKAVLANEKILKYLEGKPAKKVIVVPKKIVNIVV
jgi:leucyl-tRNA synthetase